MSSVPETEAPVAKRGNFPAVTLLATDPSLAPIAEAFLDSLEQTGAAHEPNASNDIEKDHKNGWVKFYENLFHANYGLFSRAFHQPNNVSALKLKACQIWAAFVKNENPQDATLKRLRVKALAQKDLYDAVVKAQEEEREMIKSKKINTEKKLKAYEAEYLGNTYGRRGTAKAGGKPFASTNLKKREQPAQLFLHKDEGKKKAKTMEEATGAKKDSPVETFKKCLDGLGEFQASMVTALEKASEAAAVAKKAESTTLAKELGEVMAKSNSDLVSKLADILSPNK